ncbi:EAL domain-containing protein [Paenibacillus roseipurpureus]|uniref:EAL domain-containing protein n=1 Tax=Paenibacillus roseopurpureus TaxID=2918901 RepID=A0AA96RJW2_9BACL|nr:EAL domain-containing protein [Paenibacillus sp. MBLB1832]WNR44210.1 EAL domain-containing protein [Paenibacillus sp. MBLB1832]
MGQTDRYGVLLVSDSKRSREVMKTILHTDSQLELTGIAEDGNSALICMLREKPDLVLIDMSLPELIGLTALQLIMEHSPTPVLVLSTHTSDTSIATIQAMRLGAADYFHKDMLVSGPKNDEMAAYFLHRCKLAIYNGIKGVYPAMGLKNQQLDANGSGSQLFNESLLRRRMDVEFHLRKALSQNEFKLVYQPVVDISTSHVVGLECLLRWNNPHLGQVPPSEFIAIAEESGLIHPIGEWVLREACTQNKKWQEAGLPPMFVAVNLSRKQFNNYLLGRTVATILIETGLAPKYLELEITESLSVDARLATSSLEELKKLGVRIAMDDFGTGYSSLGYLRDFPIDKMKIDKSFIKGIRHRDVNAVIVNAMITMAKQLNLLLVAEGVETEEELQILREYGCRFVQGYYYSKPVESKVIEEMLVHLI